MGALSLQLSDREQQVLLFRYPQKRTLWEIGLLLLVSWVRAWQELACAFERRTRP